MNASAPCAANRDTGSITRANMTTLALAPT